VAEWEQQTPQHIPIEHMKNVRLIFGIIGTSTEPRPVRCVDDLGMVPCRQKLESEGIGAAKESVEFQMPIAFDARIGSAPCRVIGHIGPNHVAFEVVAEVENVVLDTEMVGDSTSVVDVAHRTASSVGGTAPELHGDADNIMPGIKEQGSSNRRVDASGHGNHHGRAHQPPP
jgi:hypothetical protein